MKLPFIFLTLLILLKPALSQPSINKKLYIVYMGHSSSLQDPELLIAANHGLLAPVVGSVVEAQSCVIHHYKSSLRGLSAMLTLEQAQKLEKNEQVVSVFESQMYQTHTTHSWDFLKINNVYQYNWLPTVAKSNLIVGVLDTGIWPESESFRDTGFSPVPEKFKGRCVEGENFTTNDCNRKIIGARFYYQGYEASNGPLKPSNYTLLSARDDAGHGTHVASILTGVPVRDASEFGIAGGTARGGVPNARLSVYKVCWNGECNDADILAAMDDAIDDGVDVLSLSLGEIPKKHYYFSNVISIGSFHAFSKGILVCAAAGNSVDYGTVGNVAPWILTVGATTTDRKLQTNILLGNSKVLKGYFSLNPKHMNTFHELINASDARGEGVTPQDASSCGMNSLNPVKIKGKIVVCQGLPPDIDLDDSSAGYIFISQLADSPDNYPFATPTSFIDAEQGKELQKYMLKPSRRKPVAKISKTMAIFNTKPAPRVADYSSRGPSVINPFIIKPDVAGPGSSILGAWSPVSTNETFAEPSNYNIESGTSMSTPHIAAVVIMLKTLNPHLSPASLKSAIMTTAKNQDSVHKPIADGLSGDQATPFDYGSGQVDPVAAANVKLTYDLSSTDLQHFLCSLGATPTQLKLVNESSNTTCTVNPPSRYDLNYPSIGLDNMNGSVTVTRALTYHGFLQTEYIVHVEPPSGIRVTVSPSRLKFQKTGEKRKFQVKFDPFKTSNGSFVFGALTWSNGLTCVRSPIAASVLSLN